LKCRLIWNSNRPPILVMSILICDQNVEHRVSRENLERSVDPVWQICDPLFRWWIELTDAGSYSVDRVRFNFVFLHVLPWVRGIAIPKKLVTQYQIRRLTCKIWTDDTRVKIRFTLVLLRELIINVRNSEF